MGLYQAVDQANKDNRLGLVIYTIPNFPVPKLYSQIIHILQDAAAVSIIETSLPCTIGFSEKTNRFLQQAISQAEKNTGKSNLLDSIATFKKPSLYILYEGIVKHFSLNTLLKKIQQTSDAVMFAGSCAFQLSAMPLALEYGMNVVPAIGAWMDPPTIMKILQTCHACDFIYLMVADRTGGDILNHAMIHSAIENIKKYTARVKIAAGFGVKTPADIIGLKAIKDINAIIIGTQFLQALAVGVESAVEFLASLSAVLPYTSV